MEGQLVYVDVKDAPDRGILDDPGRLQTLVSNACDLGRAEVRQVVSERFDPQGVTVAAVLAESHATLHTYPEEAAYAVDVFTCGRKANASEIAAVIVGVLGGRSRWTHVVRGNRD